MMPEIDGFQVLTQAMKADPVLREDAGHRTLRNP